MKKVIYLLIILSLESCGSASLLPKTVRHLYTNTTFMPESLKKQVIGNLEINIVPIDAKVLDKESAIASGRDGNYQKERIDSKYIKIVEKEGESKTEKKRRSLIIKLLKAIDKLEKEDQINSLIAYKLKERVLYGEEVGNDGSEIESLAETDDAYIDTFNPFKVNKKYLSVFKIIFENTGSEIEKLNLKDFQIVSGEEQLYPLGNDYFENNLKNEQEKIKNVYRMNMPNEIVIAPNQKVVKYIAVPPINQENKKLEINLIKNNKVVNFPFELKVKPMEKTYNLDGFELKGSVISEYMDCIYVVDNNKRVYSLSKPLLYANKSVTNANKIYGIAISENGTIFFGESAIDFADVKSNKVRINFKRL